MRIVTTLLAALCCSGCVAFGYVIKPAADALTDVRDRIEYPSDFPNEVKRLSGVSLETIIAGAMRDEIWSSMELGRRYEMGEGLGRDTGCAYFWYDSATRLRYPGQGNRPGGEPYAEKAARRLKSDPAAIVDQATVERCFRVHL
jgi:hypothetical protein